MNTKILQKISYGLYVVCSGIEDKFNGQICNSMFQVTSDPLTVAISVNKSNYTYELIKLSCKFTASILPQSTPMTFIGLFGFKCGRDINKLQDVKTKTGSTGIPIVLDYSIGYLEAELVNEIDCGTHTIFIGKVVDADITGNEEPMTYDYYHQIKGGKTPKAAPSYIKEEPVRQTEKFFDSSRYVCSICGYVYDPNKGDPDGDIAVGTSFQDLPDGWICPICGATKTAFEKG
jgi:flavin reductase (DIM6/NTAB) family NADH-FMN oxidoreductase RutF/rubredoxin